MNNERSGTGLTTAAGFAAWGVSGLVTSFVPLLFVVMNRELKLTFVTLGLFILLHFALCAAGDLFSGRLASKIGYKLTIVLGSILTTFGLLGLGFLPDIIGGVLGVLISAVLTGAGAGLTVVPAGNLIRSVSDGDDEKIKYLHLYRCAGQAAAVLLSALFLALAGIEKWRILSTLWAIVPIVVALLLLFADFYEPEEDEFEFSGLFGNPMFGILMILMFFAGAAEQSMTQWIAAFAEVSTEIAGLAGRLVGPFLFVIGVGISRFLFLKFADRIRLQRVMIYGAALAAAAYLLAILSGNQILSLVGCVLVGIASGFLRPATFSLASSKITGEETKAFALLMLAGDLGYGAGPALVGIAAGMIDNNLKKGMFIALLFPIAMIITIMKVNKNLAGKLIREKKTWIGIACAALIITLSAFTGGCTGTAVTTPTPTPTKIVVEPPVPISTLPPATETPIPTFTPTPVPATPTLSPTPTPTRKPTSTPTPVPTGFAGVTITPRTGIVFSTDSINIRIGPGTGYKVVGGGKVNEEFKLTGETSNGWWQISYDGGTAYISKDYSKLKGEAPTCTPTIGLAVTATPTPKASVTNPPATTDFEKYVGFTGASYIAIDAKTGDVLHAYNEKIKRSPASLTKMMTALIAVEQFYLNDECPAALDTLRWNDVSYQGETVEGLDNEMATFADLVASKTGVKYTAEQWIEAPYTVEDRLYQMLIYSAADAAEALAYLMEGDVTWFAEEMMAQKATQLGLSGTYFNNAAGADSSCSDAFAGNVSTAQDLAIIAKNLMEDGTLRKIVSTKTYTVPASGEIPATLITNGNLLLTDSTYRSNNFTCIGIKTGHTDEAGYCLAACGKDSDGNEVIVITLGNRTRQENAEQTMKMLDYIFKYER